MKMDEYLTPEEMRAAEAAAAARGINTETLMENAGRALAKVVDERYGKRGVRQRVLVVCGTGNNGGDGLVAARYLEESKDWSVLVLLLGGPAAIKTKEALKNWARAENLVISVGDLEALRAHKKFFDRADVIVDAVLGTGIRGEMREPASTAVSMVNAAKARKVAADVPTGLDPLTGELSTQAVRADLTVTFHRAKVGMRGKGNYTGEVLVVPIGIDEEPR